MFCGLLMRLISVEMEEESRKGSSEDADIMETQWSRLKSEMIMRGEDERSTSSFRQSQ